GVDRRDRLPDQQRAELLVDQPHDARLQLVVVAVEAFAGNPGVGHDAGDDRAAMRKLDAGADRGALELRLERDRLDPHDADGGDVRRSLSNGSFLFGKTYIHRDVSTAVLWQLFRHSIETSCCYPIVRKLQTNSPRDRK